jgi:hypothetical protein
MRPYDDYLRSRLVSLTDHALDRLLCRAFFGHSITSSFPVGLESTGDAESMALLSNSAPSLLFRIPGVR